MKMKNRFIAVFLAVCLITSPLLGCSKRKKEATGTTSPETTHSSESTGIVTGPNDSIGGSGLELTGIVPEPIDGIGEPGKDFVILKTGDANDWQDIPVPKFNPLGSCSLYSGVDYDGVGHEDVVFYSLDGYQEKREIKRGERWQFTITDPDYSLYWLRWYTRESGGKWYYGTRDHSTFVIQESDTVSWYADAQQLDEDVYITVVKVNTLPVGKTLTLRPNEIEEYEYYFYTPPTNGKLQSAIVSLKGDEECGVQLDITSKSQYGNYIYETSFSRYDFDLILKKTDNFILDDLPIAEGDLSWRLTWGEHTTIPDEITIQLNTVADIPPVKWGELPGAIRVTGIPVGDASVCIPDWAGITYPEVMKGSHELTGITDENGDMFFTAPAGYYNIRVESGAGEVDESYLRLIPVNSGEITTVTIPQGVTVAAGALSRLYGDFDENEGGIVLLGNKVQGNNAIATFILNDPLERDLFPEKEDIKITEDGVEAVITKIEREPAGSNVVLVLDSSGSMGDNMKPCVEAAKRFVNSLPENTVISLIQFAQKITEHGGNDKASVIKALDSVKAGGATALYDATARALSQLKGKKRGYAVIFSDGADSREPGVDGEGSALSKEQIIEKIKESGVTVLTIGFGKGHDPSTLIAMSGASAGGAYFAAADKNALEGAFASVAGKFGNQFTVTYERPVIPQNISSSVPVVSMMIDRSGSMDMEPEPGENVGWRMDRIKEIFHNFILKLPYGTLMQLASFACPEGGQNPRFDQLITDQKANILQAVGSLEAGGGTPTRVALTMAYYNLAPIPSQKRVLVFFTDAGLYDPGNPDELDEILEKYKETGIKVLFAGLSDQTGDRELNEIFQTAALKAGGDYILTDSMEEIAKKLDELLAKIDTPSSKEGVDFTLGLDCQTEDGDSMRFYTIANLPDFTPKTGAGQQLNPQVISYKTGEKYVIYNKDAANLLYGGDQPVTQTNVLLRMPFENAQGSNDYSKLSITEAYLMDVFKGIPAPSGQVYLALYASLEFVKKDRSSPMVGYSIPSIFNHFYVSVNEGRMMPPSEATWLAEKPFTVPGENEVYLSEKEPVTGMLVFLVDYGNQNSLTQLSLHMYDTVNGHIELPLAGKLTKQMLEMQNLPTETPAMLNKTFSLAVTGKTDKTTIGDVSLYQMDPDYHESRKNATFRILEARFDSKVQALLEIEPMERFYYKIDTDQGVLMAAMNDIIHHLPLGFVGSTYLAPGSCNNVRLPFVLPNELLNSKASLYADIIDGSQEWSIINGLPFKTGSLNKRYSHEYFDLTINSLSMDQENGSFAVLDFTLHDKKDGMGTSGLEGVLQLEREDSSQIDKVQQAVAGRSGLASFAGGDETVVTASLRGTGELIFGAMQEVGMWGAFDGQSRRGILLFPISSEEPNEWTLTSPLLPDLKLPVSAEPYPYTSLLALKPQISVDNYFEKALSEAVSSAIASYEATRPAPGERAKVGLTDDEVMGKQVPSPSLTLYGSQRIKEIKTDADFLKLMRELRWIPSDSGSGDSILYRYAPEAVITQGWGGQYDLAVLSKTLLARLGYLPEYRTVTMTAAGEKNLRRLSGLEEVPKTLVGVFYTDANGMQKLFVPVFSADLFELQGLGYLATDQHKVEISPAKGSIRIELHGKLVGVAASIMSENAELWGTFSETLSGEEEEGDSGFYEDIIIFDRELSMPDLSLDAFDISYLSKSKPDGGAFLLPVLDTRQGLIYDQNSWVDSSYYEFDRLNIFLGENGKEVTHTVILSDKQKLNEITHTLAWGVPELCDKAAQAIEVMANAEATAAKEPANYSISRWLGHATLSRLIKGLTEADTEYAKELGIVAGRTDQSIALVVTTKSDGKTAESSVDLVNHHNQLHSGTEHERHAYNLMYGYFASDMEAAALPDDEGYGYLEVWNRLPEGAKIHPIPIEQDSDPETVIEELRQKGYPALLLERMQGGDYGEQPEVLYLVPDRPAEINGKLRWAWLEIDMKSYDVVSVFETGQRSGMEDYILACLPENGNYAEIGVGMLVGVTTAVGSVAAYTLTGMDYKQVIESAKVLCLQIGGAIGLIASLQDSINAAGKIGKGLQSTAHSERVGQLIEGNLGIWASKLGFDDGYNYAVKAYFKDK